MCKQSILYKEGRCSASPALARNFNGSLHLYSKEFSFMRGVKRYFNFHAKIRPFSAEKFQKDQNGLRGHSRPLEAKSRNNRIYMSNLTIFVRKLKKNGATIDSAEFWSNCERSEQPPEASHDLSKCDFSNKIYLNFHAKNQHFNLHVQVDHFSK